jgi:hypothetical protein
MNIKHKKCSYFVNIGLFANLIKFEDLETRIAALPQEERGNAFEVFAQAYLATQGVTQATQVWSFDEVPQHVRAELGLSDRDMGIDGVILTNQDIYQAYQVKYRSDRESLTWQEISTFMGLSDRVATRILFTPMTRKPQGFLSLGMNGHPTSEYSKPEVCEARHVL